jgi:predicted nuclease of predicted toxin-antitoxin system
MKFKLDENLPRQIALRLRMGGNDVHTTDAEGLSGCSDSDLWNAAQREGRILITQDLDFSDVRRFAPGTHAGLVLLRLRSPSRRRLIERVEDILRSEDISNWSGCFVIVTEHKVRIRKPKNLANDQARTRQSPSR